MYATLFLYKFDDHRISTKIRVDAKGWGRGLKSHFDANCCHGRIWSLPLSAKYILDVFPGTDNGCIELSLTYLSGKGGSQGTLVVTVVRCVRLRGVDANGYSNPYIKCYLLPDPSGKSKRKSSVKKKDLHPEFNQQFR